MWIPLRTNSQVFWALAVASQPSVGNYSALTRRNVRAILRRPKNPKIGWTGCWPRGRIKIVDFIEFLVGRNQNSSPYCSVWSRARRYHFINDRHVRADNAAPMAHQP